MRTVRVARAVGIFVSVVSLFAVGAFSAETNLTTIDCSNRAVRDRVIAALRGFVPPIEGVETFRIRVDDGQVKVSGQADSSGDIRNTDFVAESDPCVTFADTNSMTVRCDNAKALALAREMLSRSLPCSLTITASGDGRDIILDGDAPSKKQKKVIKHIVEAADCVDDARIDQIGLHSYTIAPVNCTGMNDAAVKQNVIAAIKSKVSCRAFITQNIEDVVTVSRGVITLTGTAFPTVFFQAGNAAKAAAGSGCTVNNRITMVEVPPDCLKGSISCMTIDGEQWCCFGCRRCPLN